MTPDTHTLSHDVDVSHNYLRRVEPARREADKRHRCRHTLKVAAGLGITRAEYRAAVNASIAQRFHAQRSNPGARYPAA